MNESTTEPTSAESTEQSTLRRRIVQAFGGLGVLSFAAAMATPVTSLGIAAKDDESTAKEGKNLILAEEYEPSGGGEAVEQGTTLTEDMLQAPDSVLAFPEGMTGQNNAMVRLHRLESDMIAPPTNPEWTDSGYVAYSAICTHLGCTVDWDDGPDTATGNPVDHCYCHGSQYDPYEGAKVVHPPAQRELPQIGVSVTDDGTVQLTSDFEGKVGP